MEPATINRIEMQFWSSREDIENIGIIKLHVIPNVCSEYSEQQIHAIGSTYRDIIRSSWSGSSVSDTFISLCPITCFSLSRAPVFSKTLIAPVCLRLDRVIPQL